LQMMAAD